MDASCGARRAGGHGQNGRYGCHHGPGHDGSLSVRRRGADAHHDGLPHGGGDLRDAHHHASYGHRHDVHRSGHWIVRRSVRHHGDGRGCAHHCCGSVRAGLRCGSHVLQNGCAVRHLDDVDRHYGGRRHAPDCGYRRLNENHQSVAPSKPSCLVENIRRNLVSSLAG